MPPDNWLSFALPSGEEAAVVSENHQQGRKELGLPVTLYWKRSEVPSELAPALATLAEHYPLREGEGTPQLAFSGGGDAGSVTVSQDGADVQIRYGVLSDALRGLGAALAGLPEQSETLSESRSFTMLGIMLDCSRNAVMKAEHLKRWLRCLSLLGYNMVMLYTEDTYEIPDEPFFGLFRGAYTPDELKEIDEYAARLGIEMIGCIQTLGHLEQILKWGAYGRVRDTDRELLVGEPATYELIRKMIAQFAACFRSRRIHVGMDETWTLGRGRFLDLNGHKSGHDILTRHLTEVCRICDDLGVRPMIWSDMYFKFGGNMHVDYDAESVIPDEVRDAIPPSLDLVYWDYGGSTEEHYLRHIERHRALGREPVMGSGVWTWLRLWYGRSETEAYAPSCVRACKQAGLRELFFTMWGDGGGYCEFDSALAGLAFAAAEAYGEGEETLRARYEAACGISYDDTLLGSQIEYPPAGAGDPWSADSAAAATIWDDPLIGLHWLSVRARHPDHWQKALDHYRGLASALDAHRGTTEPVDVGHAATLANVLAAKIEFRMRLEEAYMGRDQGMLQAALDEVPRLVGLTEELEATFRRQWLRRNKPFGLEVIQVRLGGLRHRFIETGRLLRELIEGTRDTIPELEVGLSLPPNALASLYASNRYRGLATASSIF